MSPLETTLRIALSEAGVACNASPQEIRHTVQRIIGSPQWAREELEHACDRASKIVASWPEWKRKAAEAHLNQPFVEEPDRGPDFNAKW